MKIVLITDYLKYLRQGMKQNISMDKDIIKKVFNEHGVELIEYSYEEIVNKKINLKDSLIIYTSSQNLDYKGYIDDILYDLSKENELLPRYDIFKAHENKGYQEILKKEIGIESLSFLYFGNLKGLKNNINLIEGYPVIIKKLHGAGSSNVYKADNYRQLDKILQKINRPPKYKANLIKRMIKNRILKKKNNIELPNEDNFSGAFIIQEFVEGLTDDWKVLVFGTKYYVLNREIKENDFRASGSGKLSFIEPPKEVLEYARFINRKLDVPNVSIDIAFNGENCSLIEFQGLHFGPYTLVKSNYYYEYIENEWKMNKKTSNLSEVYAESILEYIKNKN